MEPNGLTLFTNARILTEDPLLPEASAMAVAGERIAWVGSGDRIPGEVTEAAGEVVDLAGARVVPGFIDAHMHAVMLAGFAPQISSLPPAVNSIEDLVLAIGRRRAEQGPGKWVQGWGYDEALFSEKRSPTRWDLDRGCPDAPVCIMRTCGHIRCVNSLALEIAGITRDTPDPVGGEIERDGDGEPTGVLKETARDLMTPFIPKPSVEDAVRDIVDLGELLARRGVVATTDMCSVDGTDTTPLLRAAAMRGYRQDTATYMLWDYIADDPAFTIPPEERDRGQQVFLAGVKVLTDGSVSGRTAWFDEPFIEKPQDLGKPNRGMPTATDGAIRDAMAFSRREGCQISLHAMGTRAIDRVVRMLAEAGPWDANGVPCARIEHVTAPSADAVRELARMHVPVVTQPIFPYAEIGTYIDNLGPERTRRCYPLRTLVDSGVSVALSTDSPATSWADPSNPFTTLQAAVTRRAYDGTDFGEGEALSIEEAIRLYTLEAARAVGFEDLGMLRAGYKASFAVLDRDVLSVPPCEIGTVGVKATYIRGARAA